MQMDILKQETKTLAIEQATKKDKKSEPIKYDGSEDEASRDNYPPEGLAVLWRDTLVLEIISCE